MAIVDEETRKLILKKTWCHGQAVLPIYAIVIFLWWLSLEAHPVSLVAVSLVLPIWSWYSYNAVVCIDEQHGALPYPKICTLGVLAMIAHLLTFVVATQDLSDTSHMLLAIASGLFFVETGAFLLVVTTFRNEIASSVSQPLYSNGQEDEENIID